MDRLPQTSPTARRSGRARRSTPPWKLSNLDLNRLYSQSLNCLLGQGVAQDERRAFTLNAEAADGGHTDAILAMGWFYLNGKGVARDLERARKWYRKSARHGEPKAMFSLGQMACAQRDFSDAVIWFRRASEAGHARSFYWLGKHCWRGQGVGPDRKAAMRLFQRAASSKVPEAQRALRFLAARQR